MGAADTARHYPVGLARRERILDAADLLFRQSGFAAPSLREIARQADISHSGLLYYFATKEELLDALLDRHEQADERADTRADERADERPREGAGKRSGERSEHRSGKRPGEGPAHRSGERPGKGSDLRSREESGEKSDRGSGEGPSSLQGRAALLAAARRDASAPGRAELYAVLGGEAARADHPAHARMARHYRRLRERTARQLAATVPAAGLRDEANRVVAGLDGLRLLARYDPGGIDAAAYLERYLAGLAPAGPPSADPPSADPPPREPRWSVAELVARDAEEFAGPAGYASGRERRARIVDAAAEHFAARGFHAISMREIAKAVGISHSTLLHHFPGKDHLLRAVLDREDHLMITVGAGADPADVRGRLAAVVEASRRLAYQAPGLREVFSVLSGEATAPGHPAHGYFERHFATSRRYLVTVFEHLAKEGELAPGCDPEQEGVWLLALCEGLQQQYLYDPEIDPPHLLAASIARTLRPRPDAADGDPSLQLPCQ